MTPEELELRRRVGARLRELREQVSLPQRRLAKMSGLAEGDLHRIERGEQGLGYKRAVRLARALGVSVGDLLDPPVSGK